MTFRATTTEAFTDTTTWLQKGIAWFGEPETWVTAAMAWGIGFALLLAIKFGFILALRIAGASRQTSWLYWLYLITRHTSTLVLAALALAPAVQNSGLPEAIKTTGIVLATIAGVSQLAVWVYHLVMMVLYDLADDDTEQSRSLNNALSLIRTLLILTLTALAIILMLDNLGVNVTTLLAGLGIGGIAVGFAAQGIVRDLFASLSIVLDRPFVIGDFIVFSDMMGTVERIGLQTTRIRSLTGEQIIVSNNDLLTARIRNFKRMSERRVVFKLGVTYQTTPAQLERIPSLVREAVESEQMARFDRCHFSAFGDFALTYEIVYYMISADYAAYMDAQQAINLRLVRAFEDSGIGFAYPTQTIQLAHAAGSS